MTEERTRVHIAARPRDGCEHFVREHAGMRSLELFLVVLSLLAAPCRCSAFQVPSCYGQLPAGAAARCKSHEAWPPCSSQQSCRSILAQAHIFDAFSKNWQTEWRRGSKGHAARLNAAAASSDGREAAPALRKATKKKKSESQLRWAARAAAGVLLPSQLKNFHNLTELVEVLRPSRLAASRGELDGGNAAIAMNHIKRLAAGGQRRASGHAADGGYGEVTELLDAYASAVERSAPNMTVKHLSLAVNALAATYNGVPNAAKSNRDALRRLITPLTLRIAHGHAAEDLPVRSLAVSQVKTSCSISLPYCLILPLRSNMLDTRQIAGQRSEGVCRW